jgi:uncharacterized protein (DUF433 family)
MSKLTDAFERGEGMYTVSDVAFYARMHPKTLRTWFSKSKPLFRRGTSTIDDYLFSFTDLVEAIYVRMLRQDYGVSFPVIRTAIDTAKKLENVDHPFAHPNFQTVVVGKEINIIKPGSQHMVALAPNSGQVSDRIILERFIQDLEFGPDNKIIKHIAFRAPQDRVIISPEFNFGEPMLESNGYTAEVLWLAKQSEGGIKQAADAYGVEESAVKAAVDYYEGFLKHGPLKKAA